MRPAQKILIGGIGGITPAFMNLLLIDGRVLAENNFDQFVVMGWTVRAIALFTLGAVWVWLHEKEQDRLAVFQLGMLAPALITAFMNAKNVELPSQRLSPGEDSPKVSSIGWLPSASSSWVPAANASSQPERAIIGKDGAPMVLVPAGEFMMGTRESAFSRFARGLFGSPRGSVPEDEKPQRRVYLNGYYIDKYEVTTARYDEFLRETSQELPAFWDQVSLDRHGDHPVVGVNWYSAEEYCVWADKRLPTEAEWEKGARGTDGRLYPWGNHEPTDAHANYRKQWKGYATLRKVGSFEPGMSPYGILDMAGNVQEWVADWYEPDYYKSSTKQNPKGPRTQGTGEKVKRGSAWNSQPRLLLSAFRNRENPTNKSNTLGFRCAKDLDK